MTVKERSTNTMCDNKFVNHDNKFAKCDNIFVNHDNKFVNHDVANLFPGNNNKYYRKSGNNR